MISTPSHVSILTYSLPQSKKCYALFVAIMSGPSISNPNNEIFTDDTQ
jgi:hypothetical protein